jgi:uncharacterized protein with PIN domain/putative ubiquitin-RnfH superfamily antitoxin RatB of RatAB toxin-antitoxin module
MLEIRLRFYGSLNDFLPREQRQRVETHALREGASVKDVIESRGVPHPEVELVLVNGQSVSFSYRVADGDRISVYPRFFEFEPGELSCVRPAPPAELRFVLDGHLGRLAAYLRALGYDTAHERDAADDALAALACSEDRVLVTRDIGLLKRGIVRHGYWMRATQPAEQLAEIDRRWPLAKNAQPFTRCLACNVRLERVDKQAVLDRLLPRTRAVYDLILECPACRRLFWPGSHHDHLLALFARTLSEPVVIGTKKRSDC